MPNFPKSKKRPWRPEAEKQGGRLVKNTFYHTTAWRKARKLYISLHPLCEQCEGIGITTIGRVVDHIKQINRHDAFDTKGGMYGEPLDPDNLQTLCDKCHARKSAKERWQKK